MKIFSLFPTRANKNQTKSSGFLFVCGPSGFFFPPVGHPPLIEKTKGSCQFHSSEKGMNNSMDN